MVKSEENSKQFSRVRIGDVVPSGHVAVGAAFRGCRRGLAEVEDLDAAVGPFPDLDGHVLRAEGGAAHDDPAVLLVDQVFLQLSHLEERPPDPLVAPVAVDVHPQGHAVGLPVVHGALLLPAAAVATVSTGRRGGGAECEKGRRRESEDRVLFKGGQQRKGRD